MGLEFSFKGYGEGYMSRVHSGIRWTRVVISWGQKPTIRGSKAICQVTTPSRIILTLSMDSFLIFGRTWRLAPWLHEFKLLNQMMVHLHFVPLGCK